MRKLTDKGILPTGILTIDGVLSKGGRTNLNTFVAAMPASKSLRERRILVGEHIAATFDLEMAPEFGPEDMGVEPPDDLPDRANTPKPGS